MDKHINSSKTKLVSVVVPVYKNRDTVNETCIQILQIVEKNVPHIKIEIIFVDDGSQDGTWDELMRVQEMHPVQVKLVKLSRNFGQLSAILAGYDVALGDSIITISADLQDPVSLMEKMIAHWESGVDIVIASRHSRDDGIIATIFSKIAYGIARRSIPSIPQGGFDYLLMSRRATNLFLSFKGRHRFFQGDVLWLGLPTVFIPYVRVRREYGKSGWTFSKKFKYFIDLIIDSSYFPIRVMSSLGFITATTGILYSIIIVGAWFFNKTPYTGWAPIMIIILIMGGFIMMMLGTIGEYIWRMHDDMKQKPLYVVESEISTNAIK